MYIMSLLFYQVVVLANTKSGISKYFEMQLQIKDDVRRGVCFSPAKLSEIFF